MAVTVSWSAGFEPAACMAGTSCSRRSACVNQLPPRAGLGRSSPATHTSFVHAHCGHGSCWQVGCTAACMSQDWAVLLPVRQVAGTKAVPCTASVVSSSLIRTSEQAIGDKHGQRELLGTGTQLPGKQDHESMALHGLAVMLSTTSRVQLPSSACNLFQPQRLTMPLSG